jgi:hypothetical protein
MKHPAIKKYIFKGVEREKIERGRSVHVGFLHQHI